MLATVSKTITIDNLSPKSKNQKSTSSYLVEQSRPYSNIKRIEKISSHCGYGFSSRDMIFVENNAVNDQSIPLKISLKPKNETILSSKFFYEIDLKSKTLTSGLSESNKFNDLTTGEENLKRKNSNQIKLEQLKKDIKIKTSGEFKDTTDMLNADEQLIKFYKNERNKLTHTLTDNKKIEENKINKINRPLSKLILTHKWSATSNNNTFNQVMNITNNLSNKNTY